MKEENKSRLRQIEYLTDEIKDLKTFTEGFTVRSHVSGRRSMIVEESYKKYFGVIKGEVTEVKIRIPADMDSYIIKWARQEIKEKEDQLEKLLTL